jgi:hypothetical protein
MRPVNIKNSAQHLQHFDYRDCQIVATDVRRLLIFYDLGFVSRWRANRVRSSEGRGNESVTLSPFVPKLHLGTPLSAKLHLVDSSLFETAARRTRYQPRHRRAVGHALYRLPRVASLSCRRPGRRGPCLLLAMRKSTCFLKVFTFATSTVTLSPSRMMRRLRRPTR